MDKSRVLVICNPTAGRFAKGKGLLERCKRVLRGLGAVVDTEVTEAPGHAEELAGLAGDRLVIVVGGDGTVHEVVNGLPATAALGIVPAGTSNVFAGELKLPWRLESACGRAMRGKARRVDLGVAENAAGELRRFAIMAGMGFDADALTLAAARPGLKRRLGKLAYPVAGWHVYLRRGLPRLGLQVEADTIPARYAAVFNTRTFYGTHSLARDASCEDGRLDLCVIGEAGIKTCASVVARFFADLPLDGLVLSRQVREVAAAGDDAPVRVHLDGEAWGELPARFFVEPGALPVMC